MSGQAQFSGKFVEDLIEAEILYSGLYIGEFKMNIDAPPDTATDEIKGYTAVLPETIEGRIGVVQFGFSRFSLNISFIDSEFDINKSADIRQTPGNSADDVFVLSAIRKGVQLSLSYTPLSFITLGVGQDQSDMIFFSTFGDWFGRRKYYSPRQHISIFQSFFQHPPF